MSLKNPVKALNADVARKIAAGEVIDRPNAVVRELMDNAIDSGADNITVEITGGGIEKIRIVDNGSGLTKDDLSACARPHSTSKISSEEDLLKLSTLGFRGEALASIASVTRLSIQSGGWKMRASITEDHIIEKIPEYEGTIVQAEGLFENFPARRLFLKRPATEGALCKNTFIEKSLPHPERAFRFVSDGEVKLDLPKGQSLKERFLSAMQIKESPSLFYQVDGKSSLKDNCWSFKIIIGEPGVRRANKKDISIFVNDRKIQEYAVVQAIEYGGQGYFPNGSFPVAAAFIQIDPALVDFNIHPAKKEVKFKDISSLHHGISSTLRSFFSSHLGLSLKNEETEISQSFLRYENKNNYAQKEISFPQDKTEENRSTKNETLSMRERFFSKAQQNPFVNPPQQKATFKSRGDEESFDIFSKAEKMIENYTKKEATLDIAENPPAYSSSPKNDSIDDFHFLGSALGTFIVAEKNNVLYIIDKHAAHERMIFDSIMENQGKFQSLLIPYEIETKDEAEDRYMESISGELEKIGFKCKNAGDGKWEFSTLNERWKGSEEDLEHAIFDKKVAPKDIIYSMAAMTACKAAVKDGWTLLDSTAEEIARGALSLKDPHCPHGRPCYFSLTREKLFSLVRRTE